MNESLLPEQSTVNPDRVPEKKLHQVPPVNPNNSFASQITETLNTDCLTDEYVLDVAFEDTRNYNDRRHYPITFTTPTKDHADGTIVRKEFGHYIIYATDPKSAAMELRSSLENEVAAYRDDPSRSHKPQTEVNGMQLVDFDLSDIADLTLEQKVVKPTKPDLNVKPGLTSPGVSYTTVA